MAVESGGVVSAAVEGIVDEAVIRMLVGEAGGSVDAVYNKNGKSSLRKSIAGYNNAARFSPWIVLLDLDQDADCAPPLLADWLPAPAVSYTHLRAHETRHDLVCRLLLEKKNEKLSTKKKLSTDLQ